jgi:hypothetical protein
MDLIVFFCVISRDVRGLYQLMYVCCIPSIVQISQQSENNSYPMPTFPALSDLHTPVSYQPQVNEPNLRFTSSMLDQEQGSYFSPQNLPTLLPGNSSTGGHTSNTELNIVTQLSGTDSTEKSGSVMTAVRFMASENMDTPIFSGVQLESKLREEHESPPEVFDLMQSRIVSALSPSESELHPETLPEPFDRSYRTESIANQDLQAISESEHASVDIGGWIFNTLGLHNLNLMALSFQSPEDNPP